MHVGGWARIGIVLSVLYGAFVAFIAYDSRPRLEYRHMSWFSEASDVMAAAISKAEGKEVRAYQVRQALLNESDAENAAWLEEVARAPSENQKLYSAEIVRVNEKHRALLAALPREQRDHWLISLVWWVAGVLLLFATGWTVRWVYRGFRQNAA